MLAATALPQKPVAAADGLGFGDGPQRDMGHSSPIASVVYVPLDRFGGGYNVVHNICSGNRISTPCRIHGGEPGSFGEILGVDGGSCRTACAADPTFDRQTSCDATLTTVTLATRAILSQCPRCGDNGEAAPLIYIRFMDNIFILGPTRGYGSQ